MDNFGRIRSIYDMDPCHVSEVYVPDWNVSCGSLLDDASECCELVDFYTHPGAFVDIRNMSIDRFYQNLT